MSGDRPFLDHARGVTGDHTVAARRRGQRCERRMLANDRLKLELATLKRPARLEAIARGQLGMAPADASVVDSVAARPAPHAAEGRRTLADRRSPR